MIIKDGFNDNKEHRWKMNVHYIQGCEISIIATDSGLVIDGNVISWGELEIAKREAHKI